MKHQRNAVIYEQNNDGPVENTLKEYTKSTQKVQKGTILQKKKKVHKRYTNGTQIKKTK